MSTIDTGCYPAYIFEERMSAFQFTNAYYSGRYVAIYSQQSDVEMTNFIGITAGISLDVYIIMLFFWCALVFLFALIENRRPSSEKAFNWST